MVKPYRLEPVQGSADPRLQERPTYNLYDERGHWIARGAGKTQPLAEAHARRHAAALLMEAALRAFATSPDFGSTLHAHPTWRQAYAARRFVDRGNVGGGVS